MPRKVRQKISVRSHERHREADRMRKRLEKESAERDDREPQPGPSTERTTKRRRCRSQSSSTSSDPHLENAPLSRGIVKRRRLRSEPSSPPVASDESDRENVPLAERIESEEAQRYFRERDDDPEYISFDDGVESSEPSEDVFGDCASDMEDAGWIVVPLEPALHPPRRRRTYRHGVSHATPERIATVGRYDLGQFLPRCRDCQAFYFEGEVKWHANRRGEYRICCHWGKVRPPPLLDCPRELQELMTLPAHRQFQAKIRYYNSHLAFASFNADLKHSYDGRGAYCFKIAGQVYHRTEQLQPGEDRAARHNQLYFVDSAEAVNRRMGASTELDEDLVRRLDVLLREINPFARSFRMVREYLAVGGADVPELKLGFKSRPDDRRFDHPQENEIAVVFTGEAPRDVTLTVHNRRDDSQISIRNLCSVADPMVYPLLFPRGEYGYQINVPHVGLNATGQRNTMTFRQYYAHRIALRDGFSTLLYGGRLFQQYIVDAWVKCESNDLWYLRDHQVALRAESYAGLQRYVENLAEQQDARTGRICVLPANHIGSPRALQRQYNEAMTIVARYGKPCLFVTMTANPNWPEITDLLQHSQKREHLPNLVVRVFKAKFEELMDDFVEKDLFGHVVNWMYAIEFQKRGLPHAHILFTFGDGDKVTDENTIDDLISAELPHPAREPEMHALVAKHMTHPRCDARCRKEGRCSKGFPKNFAEATTFDAGNGRPVYKRPRNDVSCTAQGVRTFNDRVVPYNRYLLKKYDCHINVEACVSIRSVKYIYKYIYKGYDCARVEFRGAEEGNVLHWDEITNYEDCRYVSSPEAAWRILEFNMYAKSHAVESLPIHMPGEQNLVFVDGREAAAVAGAANRPSKLMAYFALNAGELGNLARPYKYSEIPEHFRWESHQWMERARPRKMLGMLNEVPRCPNTEELFYLRMLLLNRRGATSFEDLRTVLGVLCDTFREACVRLHLLEDDEEYARCLEEAQLRLTGMEFRRLFVFILGLADHNVTARAPDLYARFRERLCEDFRGRGQSPQRAEVNALTDIEERLQRLYNAELRHFRLPAIRPEEDITDEPADAAVPSEAGSERPDEVGLDDLNAEQLAFYWAVVDKVVAYNRRERVERNIVFLDGPGGTGKTYVYEKILTNMAAFGVPFVAMAWTGIAATLLRDGCTVHRAFRLPVPVHEEAASAHNLNSEGAQRIKYARLLLWDEAPMAPKAALHVVDTFLRTLMGVDLPMGGKIVVLGGDFRQIMPIVPRGMRTGLMSVTLKSSPLWPRIEKHSLRVNVRAEMTRDGRPRVGRDLREAREYAGWLQRLGDGTLPTLPGTATRPDDLIEIPRDMLMMPRDNQNRYARMLTAVFGARLKDGPEKRAVLVTTNLDVFEVNDMALERLEGPAATFLSKDTYEDVRGQAHMEVTEEFLNSVRLGGLPPHELRLKAGAIVMLLRNIDLEAGLCNGTRCEVTEMQEHCLTVRIVTGRCAGQQAFLPRMKITTRDSSLPFAISRLQFPVRLSYAMTINKAQGQTLEKVGVLLNKPCFTHGQLYVALSRVGMRRDAIVYVSESTSQGSVGLRGGKIYTRNVVNREIVESEALPVPDAERRDAANPVGAEDDADDDGSNPSVEHPATPEPFEFGDVRVMSDEERPPPPPPPPPAPRRDTRGGAEPQPSTSRAPDPCIQSVHSPPPPRRDTRGGASDPPAPPRRGTRGREQPQPGTSTEGEMPALTSRWNTRAEHSSQSRPITRSQVRGKRGAPSAPPAPSSPPRGPPRGRRERVYLSSDSD